MPSPSNECYIQLALQAIQTTPGLSIRRAASIYNLPRSTLQARLDGRTAKADSKNARLILTTTEEKALLQYILERDSRGFSPRRVDVEDMANLLLSKRDAKPVGKLWVHRFVNRRPELKTRFSRVYDYQRALCEDPDALKAWFQLVKNMRDKYGIHDRDFYNFDETGFMMGMIQPKMVITHSDRVGKPKSIQPGNREWATAICCVAGDGYTVPPFLVVQGRYHLAGWFANGQIPDGWMVKTTSNGWTTNETGLEWLQHFDEHSKSRRMGAYRMLVLDGHESHVNATFEDYCKQNNIITLCLPAHSSHLTQPLDVGCFSVLKSKYSGEINSLVKAHITHITKPDFFAAFQTAFSDTMTKENILGGFRGAGLIPLDPEAVLSKLDIKLRTPSPLGSSNGTPEPWVSKTPQTTKEAVSQSTLIKGKITNHQGSSPTHIFSAVEQYSKGMMAISHKLVLVEDRVRQLEAANAILAKRRRAKRTRLQDGGVLEGSQARDLMAEKGVVEEERRDEGENGGPSKRRQTGSRLCGICRKAGHNARTCPEAGKTDSSDDSE
jgi:hypothetical protein